MLAQQPFKSSRDIPACLLRLATAAAAAAAAAVQCMSGDVPVACSSSCLMPIIQQMSATADDRQL
jgi:hypothetical protein